MYNLVNRSTIVKRIVEDRRPINIVEDDDFNENILQATVVYEYIGIATTSIHQLYKAEF